MKNFFSLYIFFDFFADPVKSDIFASAYLQGRVEFPTGGIVREPVDGE